MIYAWLLHGVALTDLPWKEANFRLDGAQWTLDGVAEADSLGKALNA